jgi:BASS family bile acid:Na+ symporter
MQRWLTILTNAFPVWVILGGALALIWPDWFTWFSGPWIVWGLALIMLGMGVTLSVDDFRRLRTMPKAIFFGFCAQFTIMPLLGFGIARLLDLPTPFAVGLILVACCPGGTASNVVTYLARANVALSVAMTMVSTFAAVIMTPLLTSALAGTFVEVDAVALLTSTVQVVIIPVTLGVMLNRWAPRLVHASLSYSPLIAVLTIALICSSIIGQSAEAIRTGALSLLLSVFLLHAGGFALGYLSARLMGYEVEIARTISIEVGMQNSGLGVVLARRHFADPLTAVPCAISSVVHSAVGSLLAGVWRMRGNTPKGCSDGELANGGQVPSGDSARP